MHAFFFYLIPIYMSSNPQDLTELNKNEGRQNKVDLLLKAYKGLFSLYYDGYRNRANVDDLFFFKSGCIDFPLWKFSEIVYKDVYRTMGVFGNQNGFNVLQHKEITIKISNGDNPGDDDVKAQHEGYVNDWLNQAASTNGFDGKIVELVGHPPLFSAKFSFSWSFVRGFLRRPSEFKDVLNMWAMNAGAIFYAGTINPNGIREPNVWQIKLVHPTEARKPLK